MLPDSQLDRFMMRLSLGYPDEMSEIEIINRKKVEIQLIQSTRFYRLRNCS